MDVTTRYREIEVSGPPRQLGGQIGEAARDEIRGFSALALDRLSSQAPDGVAAALEAANASASFVEDYAPHLLDEIRGIADGAGIPFEQVMLLQVRNQLDATLEAGCTSVALPAEARSGRGPVVAQNWDNDAALSGSIVVITRRPVGQPALMTVGPAGLIAYIGFNDRGLAACLNTLPAPRRDEGVPHYFTLRQLFGGSSLDEALAAVERAQRVIPANIMLSTPGGPADLEVGIDGVYVLHDGGPHGAVTHTNHCLHPQLRTVAERYGDLAQSRARKTRIDALLGTSPIGIPDLQDALRDHAAYPRSICRHPNDDAATGWWQTVLSVIIEPREGRMHVSRGNPCGRPYERYVLA